MLNFSINVLETEQTPAIVSSPRDRNYLPCYIRHRRSPMRDEGKRERALMACAHAIASFKHNSERAVYLRDTCNAELDAHWQVVWRHADCQDCTVSHTFCSDNCIVFRMGEALITLWAQKKYVLS